MTRTRIFAQPLQNVSYLPTEAVEAVSVESYACTDAPTFMGVDSPRKWAVAPSWSKVQPPVAQGPDLDKRLEGAYDAYRLLEKTYYLRSEHLKKVRMGHFTRKVDKLRWKLHLKLLDWGVIV